MSLPNPTPTRSMSLPIEASTHHESLSTNPPDDSGRSPPIPRATPPAAPPFQHLPSPFHPPIIQANDEVCTVNGLTGAARSSSFSPSLSQYNPGQQTATNSLPPTASTSPLPNTNTVQAQHAHYALQVSVLPLTSPTQPSLHHTLSERTHHRE